MMREQNQGKEPSQNKKQNKKNLDLKIVKPSKVKLLVS